MKGGLIINGDEKIELLPSEGVVLTPVDDGTVDVQKRITDMLVKISDRCYIIECQSDNDLAKDKDKGQLPYRRSSRL